MYTNEDMIAYCAVDLRKKIKGDAKNADENITVFFNRMYRHVVNNLPGIKTENLTEAESATMKNTVLEQAFFQLSVGDPSLMLERLSPLSHEAMKIAKNGGLWSPTNSTYARQPFEVR